jgi:hypothetical protein
VLPKPKAEPVPKTVHPAATVFVFLAAAASIVVPDFRAAAERFGLSHRDRRRAFADEVTAARLPSPEMSLHESA